MHSAVDLYLQKERTVTKARQDKAKKEGDRKQRRYSYIVCGERPESRHFSFSLAMIL